MDILLNDQGDIDLGTNFTMSLVKTKEQLTKQKIKITLNTNRGEWAFNINFGVPWLRNEYNNISILTKVPKGIFDSAIKDAILTREGVVEILEYRSVVDKVTRKVTVEAKVETEQGGIVSISSDLVI